MTINATFIGQILVFLILLWFIARFITPALSQALNERQKKIADGLAAAERGQKDLADAQSRADGVIKEARDRANQIIDQANRRSNEIVDAAKGTAQHESERIVTAARGEAATEAARARDALRREVGSLVAAGAARLLEREVDAKAHADLLDKLASEIGRS
ncbi:MAG: F0F1 ATP synthase subunit B [Pseudomonadales bacterium]|nr:F0F1 ATP synthase subunit B [Pseudomonadales bacterium]